MRASKKPIESRRGAAGEFLVCADLCMKGHSATLAAAGEPYDVIADIDNSLKRIQVKARSESLHFTFTTASRILDEHGKRIRTLMDLDAVDYVACVKLDTKQIAYLPIELLRNNDGHVRSMTLNQAHFQTYETLT